MKFFKRLALIDKVYLGLVIIYLGIQIHVRYLNTIRNLAYWGKTAYIIAFFKTIFWALIFLRVSLRFIHILYRNSKKEKSGHKLPFILGMVAMPFVSIAFLLLFSLSFTFLDEIKEVKIEFEDTEYVAIHDGGFINCDIYLYEYKDEQFRAYAPSYSSQIKYSCPRELPIPFEDSSFVSSPHFKKYDIEN